MKNAIERNQFRKNFLKEIIMRLDFQSILQTELEKIFSIVKHYLKTKYFTRYKKETNSIAQNQKKLIDVDESNEQIIYSFMNENSGYTIKLSNTSAILQVNTVSYSPFEVYSEIFYNIVRIIKENVDLFTVKRFGFRKINFCLVSELKNINKYFEPKYYSIEEPITKNVDINIINRTSKLSTDKKNINIHYIIERGEIQQKTYFKVTLDTDIYSNDENVIKNIFDNSNISKELCEINDMLFAIYRDTITEEFAFILSREENNIPEDLLGVEDNV